MQVGIQVAERDQAGPALQNRALLVVQSPCGMAQLRRTQRNRPFGRQQLLEGPGSSYRGCTPRTPRRGSASSTPSPTVVEGVHPMCTWKSIRIRGTAGVHPDHLAVIIRAASERRNSTRLARLRARPAPAGRIPPSLRDDLLGAPAIAVMTIPAPPR